MASSSSRLSFLITASALALALGAGTAVGGMDEARRYVETEFQPSTLSKEDQLKEMEWLVNAAKPFQGMEVNIVSETITTHEYEARTLAKAFTEITGIKVTHDVIQEGDVVEKIQTQMQSGKNIYDGWINDFGPHWYPFPLWPDRRAFRLDVRRGQRCDFADSRRERLHW